MHNMNLAEQNEFDRKVRELCADPKLLLRDIAAQLNSNLSAVARSLRRQKINRPIVGRPKVG
jgi:IS30 family transposase